MSDRAERVALLRALCREWVAAEPGRALSLHVAQAGQTIVEEGFGVTPMLGDRAGAAQADTIYLSASLTKPVTALAVCLLVERGALLLQDPVCTYIPEFGADPRQRILIRHLLTHTSGLPDMLPENTELRRAHAPLPLFVERVCRTPLLFEPGADCSYQSMGILLAAEIVQRVSGMPLPAFVEREVLDPAGMGDTWLGGALRQPGRVARVQVNADEEQQSWTWNSCYWRELGAPWGGLHTTARDYARLLGIMLDGGAPLLGRAMTRAMVADQLAGLPGLSEKTKLDNGWGLGWALNVPCGAHFMPESGPRTVFGHGGATGTAAWANPESRQSCVILTNDPQSAPLRRRLSNVIAGLAGS